MPEIAGVITPLDPTYPQTVSVVWKIEDKFYI